MTAVKETLGPGNRKRNYLHRRCYADLSSQYIESLPSLHLTEEEDFRNSNVVKQNAKKRYLNQSSDDNSTRRDFLNDAKAVNLMNENIQIAPNVYHFQAIDVTLFSEEFFDRNNLYFRKLIPNNNNPYEGMVKLNLYNGCPTPVAFKIMCNNMEETKAIPNIGVIQCCEEGILKIYLKKWKEEHAKHLVFKILTATLNDEFDASTVWHHPNAVISNTPRLRCVLVHEDPISEQKNFEETLPADDTEEEIEPPEVITVKYLTPRPTYMPRWVETKQRKGVFRRILRRMIKIWRRLRGKQPKTRIDRM